MQQFIKKQYRLNAALDKIKARLKYYSENEERWQEFKDWNNWHDLQDRIEARLKDNYSDYQCWHFEKYQFIAI